jgi:hypothetical protein
LLGVWISQSLPDGLIASLLHPRSFNYTDALYRM